VSPLDLFTASNHGVEDFAQAGVLRSGVVGLRRRGLSDETMAKVNAVNPVRFESMLRQSGIGEPAIQGARERLSEIQADGMITGRNWPGIINTGRLSRVK
jgi:hypothetical protein